MRRTYRSKKETGGGLDPRDVVLTMDEKSSVFDAFYIQNIKQSKRDLSVGFSMYAASNKVRKRKYVKRLKEQEPIIKDSMSRSTYLTPDKSIHVKRAPDAFDLLLNSSSINEKSSQPVNNALSPLQTRGKRTTHSKQKGVFKQKFNIFDNDNEDLGKENSFIRSDNSLIQNTSNILSHKLQIEKDTNVNSLYTEDSINNIVSNLPLLEKDQYANFQSPSVLSTMNNEIMNISSIPNSPLCSTPFFKKYKGKSIFKLSPISANAGDDSKIKIMPEKLPENTVESVNESILSPKYDKSMTFDDNQSPIFSSRTFNDRGKTKDIKVNVHCISLSDESLTQTSEVEPFLGFLDNSVSMARNRNLEAIVNKYVEIKEPFIASTLSNEKQPLNFTASDTEDRNSIMEKEISFTVLHAHSHNEDLFSKTKSSLYSPQLDFIINPKDTCSLEVNNSVVEIDVEDSINRYKEIGQGTANETIDEAPSHTCLEENSIVKNECEHTSYKEETSSDSEANESLYESCSSAHESSDTEKEGSRLKQPLVVIEMLSDSVFQKYYKKAADKSQNDESYSDSSFNSSSQAYTGINNSDTVSENISSSSVDSYENNVGEDTVSNISIVEQDADDYNFENNKSDEDNCISFVTKRRRNDITKDSFILSFENSLTSACSGDFDKTVLSNNKKSVDDDSLRESSDITSMDNFQIETNDLVLQNAQICNDELLVVKDNNITDICTLTDLSPLPKVIRKSKSSTHNIKRPSPTTRRSAILSIEDMNRKSVTGKNYGISSSLVGNANTVTRKSSRLNKESLNTNSISGMDQNGLPQNCEVETAHDSTFNYLTKSEIKQGIVLEPGKRWERSLSIYKRMTTISDHFDHSILDDEPLNTKGRKYRQSVISTMERQDSSVSLHNESVKSRASTIYSKPSRSTIKILRETNASIYSLCSTTLSEDLQGFLTEDCDDTIVELSKLSIIDSEHEVTVLDKFNDTSNRITTARDYVLRRCNQTDVLLFDECYPDTVLKNCRKIGEGVYGEVFLWRAGDGRARVLKIVPIAGVTKVNGENQKDYQEIISEIVIAMELSALRAPIQDIEKHFDEGEGVETLDLHSVENATDVFNEVLAVHCLYGSYPSRLLDLWDLYDECKGSENDNPAILPVDQQFMVLELANAGQDLESYQFNNAEQAYALFEQVAFGLAVAEETFQFEHRDLHWGNVLISPTDQKYATFVLRGRTHRVARRGVAATIIDYSLSRLSLRLPSADSAALYNDLATDDGLFDAVGDYQFEVYRHMRDKLGNDWKNFEPYTNILWLHYTVDKMITALRYSRTNTKIHKHYIAKLKEIKNRILDYGSAVQYILTDNEL